MKRSVAVVLIVWFVVALLVVGSGLFARLPFPPPLLIVGLALATIMAGLGNAGLRRWLLTVDLRALLAVHLVRFVGFVFLYLVGRGVLTRAFLPIGWGDAMSAVGAVALLLAHRKVSDLTGFWMLLIWNTFGFIDMVLLIATGVRVGLAAPEQFALFQRLPFGLLPTFFVPLIIATHVFIFVRLYRARRTP